MILKIEMVCVVYVHWSLVCQRATQDLEGWPQSFPNWSTNPQNPWIHHLTPLDARHALLATSHFFIYFLSLTSGLHHASLSGSVVRIQTLLLWQKTIFSVQNFIEIDCVIATNWATILTQHAKAKIWNIHGLRQKALTYISPTAAKKKKPAVHKCLDWVTKRCTLMFHLPKCMGPQDPWLHHQTKMSLSFQVIVFYVGLHKYIIVLEFLQWTFGAVVHAVWPGIPSWCTCQYDVPVLQS